LDYPIIFGEPSRLTDITSWHEHIPFAFWIIETLRPTTFVELGTHKGDSYGAFCQAVSQLELPTACYAVDTWRGDEHAGLYDEDVFTQFKTYHDQQYGRFSQMIRLTFDEALEHFSDRSIDLLHIDGLHTYDAVRRDFVRWLTKMSKRGVILFHDTNVHERGFGVWKLWEELREQYPSFEFMHGHGLGMLMVGEASAKEDCALLTAQTDAQKERVQKLFYVLGSRVALQRDVARLQKTGMELYGQLANLEQVLAERDSRITDLNQAMQERAAQIVKLEQAVEGRETQIAEHDERIVNLKQIVTERSEEIGAYQREVEELDTLLKQARAGNDNLEQVIAERARQIAERDGRIAAMTVSRSWQVTKPLRFVGRLLRREFAMALVPGALKDGDESPSGLRGAHAERGAQMRRLNEQFEPVTEQAIQTRRERQQELQNPPFRAPGWLAAIRQRLAQRIRRDKRGLGRP